MVTSSMADKMVFGLQTRNCSRTCRQKRSSNGTGGRLGAQWGKAGSVSLSALTSSCGRRLMRIRSAFSLSCLLSMRAKRSLEALSWGGEVLAEGSCALPLPRASEWMETPLPWSAVAPPALKRAEPHTVEMHQPCPTKPTRSHTGGPDTRTVPTTAATSPHSHASKPTQ